LNGLNPPSMKYTFGKNKKTEKRWNNNCKCVLQSMINWIQYYCKQKCGMFGNLDQHSQHQLPGRLHSVELFAILDKSGSEKEVYLAAFFFFFFFFFASPSSSSGGASSTTGGGVGSFFSSSFTATKRPMISLDLIM